MESDSWSLADYSNFGDNSDVVAPGDTYTAIMGGGYGNMTGTSFASPAVAGAIALYLSQNEYSTYWDVTEVLYASCYDLGDLGEDFYYGYGALDVSAFITEEKGKVTFDMLTDELDTIEQVFVREHTLQNLPEPERVFAVFDGWYYDIECTEPVNYYEDVFSSDLTLYASWVNEEDGVPYTYAELDDGTIEIQSYTGKRRFITIPEYIDGKIVSSIGDFAFDGERRLRTVNLPSQLRNIGDYAFRNCGNLVSISIPGTVTEIGSSAFENCVRISAVGLGTDNRLTTIGQYAFKGCSSITYFELPKSVTSVDGSAFFGTTSMTAFAVRSGNVNFSAVDGVLYNKSMTSVVAYPAGLSGDYMVPDGVTDIGSHAFGYTKLCGVNLDGVKSIGKYAFSYSSLENMVIPSSVEYMGDGAFSFSIRLKSLSIDGKFSAIPSGAFSSCSMLESVHINAQIESIGGNAFSKATSLRTLTFSEDSEIFSIGDSAFIGCSLESLDLPASIKTIGSYAFSGNHNLKAVAFSDNCSIISIGAYAFNDCTLLSTFEFPNGLLQIGDYALMDTKITEAQLPSSLTYLGVGAFASCRYLENIFVDDSNTTYTGIDGVVYTSDLTELVEYPAGNKRNSYTIDSTVTKIGDAAFYGSGNLTSMAFPTSLETVGEYSFYACSAITSYSLNKGLVSIEQYAFAYNSSLSSITMPDSLQQISNYVFANDRVLKKISFSDSATLPRISFAAFAYTGLTSFRVPASVSTVAQYAFEGCRSLTQITFAAGSKLESISAYMFDGCSALKTIKFEKGSALESIQAHGFEGMKNLTTVDFGDAAITNIDNYAFRFCESLTTVVIPDGVDYIGRYAFYGCKAMTRLNIPASVAYIGENAFYFAENLNVYFAADALPATLAHNWDNGIRGYYVGVKNVVETDEWTYAELNSGKYSVIEYKGEATEVDLNDLNLSADIVSVGGYAFYNTSVESVVLPEGLTEIHRYAFANTPLKSVTLPASVNFIGRYAFYMSDIASIKIPGNTALTTIEQYAFSKCKSLTEVKLPSSLVNLGHYAFKESGITSVDLTALTMTTLPEGVFMGSALTSVKLPNTLGVVDHNAFRDCTALEIVEFGTGELRLMSNVFYNTGLTSLHIPENLTYIGEYSFVGLSSLQEFTVAENNPKYTAVDGLLYSKDGRKLIAAPAGRAGDLTLPQSLEVLGFGAFENSSLTKISFHPQSNILTFGYRCFYNSELIELTVPESVVSIDFYAFAMCDELTMVEFADGISLTGIYEGAFYGCTSLSNITLPDSVIEISDYAFYGCTALTGIPVSESSELLGIYDYAFAYTDFPILTTPPSLVDIGDYAFAGCEVQQVTIPDDKARELIIGFGAFADCSELESITLPFIGASFEDPDYTWFGYIFGAGSHEGHNVYVPESLNEITITEGITEVGRNAFYGIACVDSIVANPGDGVINLPHSITTVDRGAFQNCKMRFELTSPISFDQNGYAFMYSGLSGKFTIADGTDYIRENAFGNCRCLEEVEIPDSVTRIEAHAFVWCVSMENIVIPDSVQYIGDSAFMRCDKLAEVVIPEGVTSIGFETFHLCEALTKVTLPSSIKSIASSAFKDSGVRELINNSSLPITIGSSDYGYIAMYAESVVNADGSIQYKSDDFTYLETEDGFRFSVSNGQYKLVGYLGDEDIVKLPASVNGSSYSIDRLSGVETLIVPAEIKNVTYTLGLKNLKSVKNIVFEEGIESISDSISYSCEFDSVTIPSTVTHISSDALGYAVSIKEIIVSDQSKNYVMKDGVLYDKNFTTLLKAEVDITSISIPKTVKTIAGCAFSTKILIQTLEHVYYEGTIEDWVNLGSFGGRSPVDLTDHFYFDGVELAGEVTVPYGVTEIPKGMFTGNTMITGVVLPDTVTAIGYEAFRECESLEYITIPDSLTSIGNEAFRYCESLEYITIPDSVTSIGFAAFGECFSLKEIVIPESVTSLGGAVFENCRALTFVRLPERLTKLESGLFNGCWSLEGIDLPESITYIGDSAFYSCRALKSLDIPDGVTYIGTAAFRGCSSIKEISVPNGVTSLNSQVFEYCSSLKKISLPDGITAIGSAAFNNCRALSEVDIPTSVTSIGDNAFKRCLSLISITIPENVKSIGTDAFTDCYIFEITNNSELSIAPGSEDYGMIGLYAVTVTNVDGSILTGNDKFSYKDTAEGFRFILRNGIYELIGYLGDEDSVILPASFKGKSFTIRRLNGIEELIIPGSYTSITQYLGLTNCGGVENIILEYGVEEIGYRAFRDCSSLVNVDIPMSVTRIDRDAFYSSAIFDINGWISLANPPETYYKDVLLTSYRDVEEYTVREGTRIICTQAFDYTAKTLKQLTVCGDGYGVLANCANLETLIITERPQSHTIAEYFGKNIPITLKTVVIKDSTWIESTSDFAGIEGVTIFVEADEDSQDWDKSLAGWNNENLVIYGDDWMCAEFRDADGSCIKTEYQATSKVIRQPVVKDFYFNGEYCKFVGWDTNSDGEADFIPATSKTDIYAVAVYEYHTPGVWVYVSSTCSDNGYRHLDCRECGKTLAHKVEKPLEHSLIHFDGCEATCEESGWLPYEMCTECGYSTYTEIPAIGHATENRPSCTETYTCERCGNKLVSKEHSLVHLNAKSPTCAETGWNEHEYCTDCMYSSKIEIPTTPHREVQREHIGATCTKGGFTKGSYCAECGTVIVVQKNIYAKGHRYNKHGECTECGGRINTSGGIASTDSIHTHTPGAAATCTTSQICLLCNEELNPATGHSLTQHAAKSPTCTEIGRNAYETCSACDYTTYAEVPATGHSLTQHAAKSPTCTEIGWNAYETCSACDYTTYTELPATGHIPGPEATCTKSQTCRTCDAVLAPATGHLPGAEATCTVAQKCKTCMEELTPALGHDFSDDWTIDSEATPTTPGEKSYHCTRCDERTNITEIPIPEPDATEPDETEPDVTEPKPIEPTEHVHAPGTAATCTAAQVCTECGEELAPATGHDFESTWTIDVKESYTAPGSKSHHCTRCDATADVTEIPQLEDTSETFTDISEGKWFKSAVDYAVSNGLMTGKSADKFSPNENMNRAMLVTILYRLEGEPAVSGNVPFTDLKQDWYKPAVAWAYENGIVNGTSETTFAPTNDVTREQMAKILYAYSKYKGHDVSETADLSAYPDGADTHSWAQTELAWANAVELISGSTKNGKTVLDPRGNATRAQVATILMRYCEKY